MTDRRTVAVLLFDEVEVLDFAGPFEVFSVTGLRDGSRPFDVFTVGESGQSVAARNDLRVTPTHSFESAPRPDILIVPGGYGTRREIDNEVLVEWVREVASEAELVLSVCTGALILARAGLLEGREATTHHAAIELLEQMAPHTVVLRDERVVDNGEVVLSAGVAAGMDMSFHVVARLLGEEQARETAHYIEYPWEPAG